MAVNKTIFGITFYNRDPWATYILDAFGNKIKNENFICIRIAHTFFVK